MRCLPGWACIYQLCFSKINSAKVNIYINPLHLTILLSSLALRMHDDGMVMNIMQFPVFILCDRKALVATCSLTPPFAHLRHWVLFSDCFSWQQEVLQEHTACSTVNHKMQHSNQCNPWIVCSVKKFKWSMKIKNESFARIDGLFR